LFHNNLLISLVASAPLPVRANELTNQQCVAPGMWLISYGLFGILVMRIV